MEGCLLEESVVVLALLVLLEDFPALRGVFLGWGEAQQGRSEVGDVALNQGLVGFEMVQQVVPQRILPLPTHT